MAVKPIPDGYHTVTPYLVVEGVSKLIDFLKQAFDAQEGHRTTRPDGTIMHAEVRIGDSPVMMGEAQGEFKPVPCMIYLYVNDTDTTYKRALESGATSLMEPADQFYGDRNAGVKDPVGNLWWIATHKEDVSPEELTKRAEAAMKQRRKGGSLRVVARIKARPEKVNELHSLLAGLLEPTRKEPGCVKYEMLQNKSDPAEFTFVEEWESESALQGHLSTSHVREALGKLPDLAAGDPDIRQYSLVG